MGKLIEKVSTERKRVRGTGLVAAAVARQGIAPRLQVPSGVCVIRYDNEGGKGDHRHCGKKESAYAFTSPEALLADFQHDIARWNHENRNA